MYIYAYIYIYVCMRVCNVMYVYIRKTTYNAVYTDATYTDDTQTHNLRY